jgi:radical SAM protein with 4Fe4S-binding SPASM domain
MINWNGDVVPCCWDAQSDYVLGNVFESTLEEVWLGEAYKKFRKTVYSNREEFQICRDCPTDRTENKLSRRFTLRRPLKTAE